MRNDTPLAEASEVEREVRIAYRLIEQDYHRVPENYVDPVQGVRLLRAWLRSGGFPDYEGVLLAYSVLIQQGQHTKFSRAAMLARARRGESYRSVLYGKYKLGRHSDPPVSNTGVTATTTEEGGTAR